MLFPSRLKPSLEHFTHEMTANKLEMAATAHHFSTRTSSQKPKRKQGARTPETTEPANPHRRFHCNFHVLLPKSKSITSDPLVPNIISPTFASLETQPEIEIYPPASSNIIVPQFSSSH
jgi:hypothetical protein